MKKLDAPDDWGEDTLSDFIAHANRNTIGVFVRYRGWFTRLQEIDRVFELIFTDFINPPRFIEPFLFVRSHSCFRGMVRLSTSGQLPEAYSLGRGSIESALYGFYFNKFPDTVQTWLKRDDSEAGRKQARKELVFKTMLTELAASDPDIGRVASHLYDFTIDAGAHPNRQTILLALGRTETEEHIQYGLDQLNIDPLKMTLCLKTNAQVGINALQMFGIAFPDRYKELNLSAQVQQLSRGL